MKYVCEACERLVPPAAFRIEDDLLVLKCPRCEVETRGAAEQNPSERTTTLRISLPVALLEAASEEPSSSRPPAPPLRVVSSTAPSVARASRPPPEDPFQPPPGHCPKCISPRGETAAVCPYCGLDYERFRPEELQPSDILAAAWRSVWESWESPEAHDRVLSLASERGELAALGRLYRIRLAHLPEDALAQRGREEVLRMASAGSLFLSTPPPDKSAKMKVVGLSVLFVIALAVTALLVRQLLLAGQ